MLQMPRMPRIPIRAYRSAALLLPLALVPGLTACRMGDSGSMAEPHSPATAPGGPAVAATAEQRRPPIDLAGVRIVDLTYPYDEKTLYWPTSPSTFKLETLFKGETPGGYFYSANAFCTPEHGGTHLDAPIHFAAAGRPLDQVPVEQLIGPAVVLDVSARTAADPDYRLNPAGVEAWEQKNGAIPQGAIVLLRTGWGSRWPDRKAYFGDDTPGDASKLHFPSYGAEAARLLVEQRKVGALGVDTASIDHGPSQDFIVHRIANGANVPGLENVANLGELPEKGAWVIALPIKIADGSGGPVRIVALVPES